MLKVLPLRANESFLLILWCYEFHECHIDRRLMELENKTATAIVHMGPKCRSEGRDNNSDKILRVFH